MIKDDDFRIAFAGIAPGVNLDVILDSCHSGTGTREMGTLSAAPEEEQITFRYVEPPIDYAYFLDANPTIPMKGILKPAPGEKQVIVVPGLTHVLWAGCRDYQTSAEAPIGGVHRGIFTYCFCKAVRRAGVTITRGRLDALVSADIRRLGYAQVPQLEGQRNPLGKGIYTTPKDNSDLCS
jgi:hypothetical protein